MADVVVSALALKRFFHKYEFSNKDENYVRNSLLKYKPEACNYKFDTETLIAVPGCFHPAKRDMEFQLSLIFCPGCEIQISSEYYEQLRYLGAIHKVLLGWKWNRPRPPCRDVSPTTWLDILWEWACF